MSLITPFHDSRRSLFLSLSRTLSPLIFLSQCDLDGSHISFKGIDSVASILYSCCERNREGLRKLPRVLVYYHDTASNPLYIRFYESAACMVLRLLLARSHCLRLSTRNERVAISLYLYTANVFYVHFPIIYVYIRCHTSGGYNMDYRPPIRKSFGVSCPIGFPNIRWKSEREGERESGTTRQGMWNRDEQTEAERENLTETQHIQDLRNAVLTFRLLQTLVQFSSEWFQTI